VGTPSVPWGVTPSTALFTEGVAPAELLEGSIAGLTAEDDGDWPAEEAGDSTVVDGEGRTPSSLSTYS